jgi:hypothetical protein
MRSSKPAAMKALRSRGVAGLPDVAFAAARTGSSIR